MQLPADLPLRDRPDVSLLRDVFPVSQMPLALELLAYLTPIWHGVELCRGLMLGTIEWLPALGHTAYLLAWTIGGLAAGAPRVPKAALQVTTLVARTLDRPGGRGVLLFERNLMSYRRMWPIIVSGFFEPLFYLLSLGFGLGGYVGAVVIDGARSTTRRSLRPDCSRPRR